MNIAKGVRDGLGRNVIILGIVSGLTDISSEMLYPVIPIFLTSVLNAPMSVVGFIEGTAEATASLLKAAGGWWSDRTAKRKPFVVWGYALSAVSKPVLALASSWHIVLFSRFTDRVGKGVRTSARDALLASSTDRNHWGKAFGFHRAMDTLGAAIGPLLAVFMLNRLHMSYQHVFVAAFIPAALGVLVLVAFVKESARPASAGRESVPAIPSSRAAPMSAGFRRFLCFYAVFALGNSSDVFLLLKAKQTGFSQTSVILAYVGYNIVYALCAAPAGWLSDRLGRTRTLSFGLAVFAAVYSGFAVTKNPAVIWILFAVYGFYGAFTEGVAKALIADVSEAQNRGTAMGIFQGAAGIMAFMASTAAGFMWSRISPSAPFILGACCALISCLLISARFNTEKTGGNRP